MHERTAVMTLLIGQRIALPRGKITARPVAANATSVSKAGASDRSEFTSSVSAVGCEQARLPFRLETRLNALHASRDYRPLTNCSKLVMKNSHPPLSADKLNAVVERARARLAEAEATAQTAKQQTHAAKQTRKLAKEAVRRSKKRLKQAKANVAKAKDAVDLAEAKVANAAKLAAKAQKRSAAPNETKPKRIKRRRKSAKSKSLASRPVRGGGKRVPASILVAVSR